MWMTQEDARSDFILAAAPAVLLPIVQGQLLPRVIGTGLAGNAFLRAALVFAFVGLVPLWLARYRSQGIAAFGLDAPREGLTAGLPLAAVFLAAWLAFGLLSDIGVVGALFGRLQALRSLPTVGAGVGLVDAMGLVALLVADVVSTVLLTTFLTTRARQAFREVEMTRVEALRTYGMTAAGVLLVIGLLRTLGETTLVFGIAPGLGLGVVVLLTDRLVQAGTTSSRWTMVAPGLVLVVVEVGFLGLLFNPLETLLVGGTIFTTTLVASVLVETRRYAWAAVPVLVASVVWPLLLR